MLFCLYHFLGFVGIVNFEDSFEFQNALASLGFIVKEAKALEEPFLSLRLNLQRRSVFVIVRFLKVRNLHPLPG
jgi:hypothetical protein